MSDIKSGSGGDPTAANCRMGDGHRDGCDNDLVGHRGSKSTRDVRDDILNDSTSEKVGALPHGTSKGRKNTEKSAAGVCTVSGNSQQDNSSDKIRKSLHLGLPHNRSKHHEDTNEAVQSSGVYTSIQPPQWSTGVRDGCSCVDAQGRRLQKVVDKPVLDGCTLLPMSEFVALSSGDVSVASPVADPSRVSVFSLPDITRPYAGLPSPPAICLTGFPTPSVSPSALIPGASVCVDYSSVRTSNIFSDAAISAVFPPTAALAASTAAAASAAAPPPIASSSCSLSYPAATTAGDTPIGVDTTAAENCVVSTAVVDLRSTDDPARQAAAITTSTVAASHGSPSAEAPSVTAAQTVCTFAITPLPSFSLSSSFSSCGFPASLRLLKYIAVGEGVVRDAFYIENVFSEKECEWLCKTTEKNAGYTYWDTTGTAASSYRNAWTVEMRHPSLAAIIWDRVKNHVVQNLTIVEEDEARAERDILGEWIACGINSNLLFARYTNGGHFSPHTDGCTAMDFNTRSFWPALLYLNAVTDGGETLIIDDAQKSALMDKDEMGRILPFTVPHFMLRGRAAMYIRHTAQPQWIVEAVKPLPGRMLFFHYTQMHESRAVAPGAVKYIIRTDVVYTRKVVVAERGEDHHNLQFLSKESAIGSCWEDHFLRSPLDCGASLIFLDLPLLTAPTDKEAFTLWQKAQVLAEEGMLEEAASLFKKSVKMSPALAAVYGM